MHFFDPARPRLGNGNGQLLNCTFPTALPGFYIYPVLEGSKWPERSKWAISMFVQVEKNSASPRRIVMTWDELQTFLQEYLSDPEATLSQYVAYTGFTSEPTTFDLESIGL